MKQQIDLKFLCHQFRRAADTYDAQAVIQKRVAARLLSLLTAHSGKEPQRVLEIGCGTGLLTRRLIRRISGIQELVLNDLVPDFAACAVLAPNAVSLPGDIEAVPLSGGFDLIISSSALHWLRDLNGLLAKLTAHLNPDGIIACSLYGPDNFREIRELTGIGLRYLDLEEISAIFSRHFTLAHRSETMEELSFASPEDMLRHLRQTGVNAVSRQPSWTPAKMRSFCNEYRHRFRTGQTVRLTWHSLYLLARAKQ